MTKLIQDKKYILKYSGKFCHVKGDLSIDEIENFEIPCTFVGKISLDTNNKRNIFFVENDSTYISTYIMFSDEDISSYVVKEYNSDKSQLDDLKRQLDELSKRIEEFESK